MLPRRLSSAPPLTDKECPCGLSADWVVRAQKQSAMQLLQAANVPQAGLQEFEAQWTARPDARQAAAPKAPTSWTYYSPRGEKVKGVAGLIQVFTSRLLGARPNAHLPCHGERRPPAQDNASSPSRARWSPLA